MRLMWETLGHGTVHPAEDIYRLQVVLERQAAFLPPSSPAWGSLLFLIPRGM